MKKILLCIGLLVISFGVSAAERTSNLYPDVKVIVDSAPPLYEIADTVLIYTATEDFDLDSVKSFDRELVGVASKVEKGVSPVRIFHTANTLTQPLERGTTVRLYLKRFPENDKKGHKGDEYYLIGFDNIGKGVVK